MKYASIQWRNGLPYNSDYDDIYYSQDNGLAESEHVFIKHNFALRDWRNNRQFVVFEVGFGCGLNFALTVRHWLQHADEDSTLFYVAVENQPLSPVDLRRASECWPELQSFYEQLLHAYPLLLPGQHNLALFNGRVQLQLIYMNALDALRDFEYTVDAWYLDGFAPANNPECWGQQLCDEMARCSSAGTTVSTYSSAGAVLRALNSAGFEVEKVSGYGRKRQMITANYKKNGVRKNSQPWYQLPVTPEHKKKAVVIGSGLAGMAIAWSLIRRGWRVTVLDRSEQVATQASGNPVGLLLPRLAVANKVDTLFYNNAFLYAVTVLDQLSKLTDECIWYGRGVYLAEQADKAEKLLQQYSSESEFITASFYGDVQYLNPVEGKKFLYLKRAGWVSPKNICCTIAKLCSADLQVKKADVVNIHRQDNTWQCIDKDNNSVADAAVLVLANADGVNKFDCTRWLPIQSSRGQLTMLKASNKTRIVDHAVSFGRYLIPEYDGIHYAGASYSNETASIELNDHDHVENINHVNDMIPGLFQQSDIIGGRVAFRANSIDRTPVVGPVPDREAFIDMYQDLHHGKRAEAYAPGEYLPGLYVSAAHGSRGITSSFLSAEIIAAMLQGTPMPVGNNVLQHLSAARFLIRQLKRRQTVSGQL